MKGQAHRIVLIAAPARSAQAKRPVRRPTTTGRPEGMYRETAFKTNNEAKKAYHKNESDNERSIDQNNTWWEVQDTPGFL